MPSFTGAEFYRCRVQQVPNFVGAEFDQWVPSLTDAEFTGYRVVQHSYFLRIYFAFNFLDSHISLSTYKINIVQLFLLNIYLLQI